MTEIGASRYLPVPSYQLDRGIFENFLAEEATRRGVRFVDGASWLRQQSSWPQDAAARGTHRRRPASAGRRRRTIDRTRAGWSMPAAAPACIKRKLGLAEPNAHDANAVWFRIGERIAIDDWSDDAAWRARCDPPARWLSTNHLVGAGYWAWLIPLASGSHSVGIVADASCIRSRR